MKKKSICPACDGKGIIITNHSCYGAYMTHEPMHLKCDRCCGTGQIEDVNGEYVLNYDPNDYIPEIDE